jgi:hypothetical protein
VYRAISGVQLRRRLGRRAMRAQMGTQRDQWPTRMDRMDRMGRMDGMDRRCTWKAAQIGAQKGAEMRTGRGLGRGQRDGRLLSPGRRPR